MERLSHAWLDMVAPASSLAPGQSLEVTGTFPSPSGHPHRLCPGASELAGATMSNQACERRSIVSLLQDHGLPCLASVVPWPGTLLGQSSGQTRAHPLQDLMWCKAMTLTDLWYMKDTRQPA